MLPFSEAYQQLTPGPELSNELTDGHCPSYGVGPSCVTIALLLWDKNGRALSTGVVWYV